MTAFDLVESIKDYRVLFIGDRIIDVYQYVETLGKSPKEAIIPMKHLGEERFEGGVVAASKHLETFCNSVSVHTGEQVTRKVRMVEKNYLRKLAEVHYTDEAPALVRSSGFVHDVVVIADFGHGAISNEDAKCYSEMSFFKAVNAQTNSSNIGFNLITKYPKADYIVIDEPEARLAAADRDSPIEEVIGKLADGRCGKFVVTRGINGAVGYDGEFHYCKAMSEKVVDTMGAGDAFFAVTAPMAKTGSMKDLLFIGNCAGALKVGIVGHRKPVTKAALLEFMAAHGTH